MRRGEERGDRTNRRQRRRGSYPQEHENPRRKKKGKTESFLPGNNRVREKKDLYLAETREKKRGARFPPGERKMRTSK